MKFSSLQSLRNGFCNRRPDKNGKWHEAAL
jgi:hypothetical protein